MQAIKTQAIITSITSKQDRSLGLRLSTPELSSDEKAAFMDLQGQNLNILIESTDMESKEIREIKSELDTKTPSSRLRSVIFVLWDQSGRVGEFSDFYNNKMNQIIEHLKGKLE